MDQDIIKKYIKYKKSNTERILTFLREHIAQARSSWVEVLSARYLKEDDYLYSFYDFSGVDKKNLFKSVTCRLYRKTMYPYYPTEEQFTKNYTDINTYCNALTWYVANKDIEKQKRQSRYYLYWKLEIMPPKIYFGFCWNYFKHKVKWKNVPEDLKKEFHDYITFEKYEGAYKILKQYANNDKIFKNNKVIYCRTYKLIKYRNDINVTKSD